MSWKICDARRICAAFGLSIGLVSSLALYSQPARFLLAGGRPTPKLLSSPVQSRRLYLACHGTAVGEEWWEWGGEVWTRGVGRTGRKERNDVQVQAVAHGSREAVGRQWGGMVRGGRQEEGREGEGW
eukprot:361808-Chlamydomonas_euryale.AAC.29